MESASFGLTTLPTKWLCGGVLGKMGGAWRLGVGERGWGWGCPGGRKLNREAGIYCSLYKAL